MRHIYNKSNSPVVLLLYSAQLHNNRPRDISGNNVPQLDNGEYDLIINDINSALHSGNAFRINIYTDASGSIFAQDSNNNDINNRLVVTTIYTYPYHDNFADTDVDGNFKVIFDDGSYIQNNDANNQAYWYTVVGAEPVDVKQFT
jgi:hypothetical protein